MQVKSKKLNKNALWTWFEKGGECRHPGVRDGIAMVWTWVFGGKGHERSNQFYNKLFDMGEVYTLADVHKALSSGLQRLLKCDPTDSATIPCLCIFDDTYTYSCVCIPHFRVDNCLACEKC